MSPWVAASACHPSAVTDRADTGDGAGRGFVPGFVPGAPRIALLLGMSDPSRSAVPPCPQGCSCSSWEELSPSSHRDHFSLSENPAGAAQGSALPIPRGGGQACSHSAFLGCFWHKSSTFTQCFPGTALLSVPGNISPLQNCHREKKLTQAAGGCRWSMETTSGLGNHLGT